MLGAGLGVLAGWPVSWPFDALLNLGSAPLQEAMRPPADGRVRVVVLQHGLWRSAASLHRLQRTLEAHGYEVLNPGYPSTRAGIDAHAERLAHAIVARRAAGPVDAFAFVGHSMGGLVIEEYLRRPDAVVPWACVYLGTPHRGAVLADLRRHWFLFRLAMGDQVGVELSPGADRHHRAIPCGDRSGTVVGDLGEGNASISGHDDGTVGIDEATFAGAAARVVLPLGHTRLSFDDAAIGCTLHFLRWGTFPAVTGAR